MAIGLGEITVSIDAISIAMLQCNCRQVSRKITLYAKKTQIAKFLRLSYIYDNFAYNEMKMSA